MSVQGRIRSKDLETNSVNARVLAPGAVTAEAIAPGAVGRGQIVGGSIGPDELEAGGVTAPKIGERAVEARNIALGAVEVAAFAQGIRPISIVDELPVLPDGAYPTGSLVFLTTDDKVYRNASGTWTQRTNVDDLEGKIEARHIAAGAIETDQLAANAVTAGKIQAGAIGTDELAANSISAGKIQADAVGAEQLAAIRLEVGKYISSFSYSAGVAGWAIDGDGNAEFNDVTIRDSAIAGGTFTAGTLQTATSGQRLVISDSDEISYYDSSGSLRGKITWWNAGNRFEIRADSGTAADVLLSGDVVYVQSINNRINLEAWTYVTEELFLEDHSTVASGSEANVNMTTSGRIRRILSSSSLTTKGDVTTLDEPLYRAVLDLRPFTYRSLLDGDTDRLLLGLGIEELPAALSDLLVTRDPDTGDPVTIQYDRLGVPLIGLAQEHDRRIADLEARLDAAGVA